jgi:hypothetical protein
MVPTSRAFGLSPCSSSRRASCPTSPRRPPRLSSLTRRRPARAADSSRRGLTSSSFIRTASARAPSTCSFPSPREGASALSVVGRSGSARAGGSSRDGVSSFSAAGRSAPPLTAVGGVLGSGQLRRMPPRWDWALVPCKPGNWRWPRPSQPLARPPRGCGFAEAGCDAYLLKLLALDELESVIAGLLSG